MDSKAAIKRATLVAQREVVKLDAAAIDELEALYRQAAEDIARRIAAYAGRDANVSLHEMQSVLEQVNAQLNKLATARHELMTQSLEIAADLGTQPFKASI